LGMIELFLRTKISIAKRAQATLYAYLYG